MRPGCCCSQTQRSFTQAKSACSTGCGDVSLSCIPTSITCPKSRMVKHSVTARSSDVVCLKDICTEVQSLYRVVVKSYCQCAFCLGTALFFLFRLHGCNISLSSCASVVCNAMLCHATRGCPSHDRFWNPLPSDTEFMSSARDHSFFPLAARAGVKGCEQVLSRCGVLCL